jgi:hypothetical protein
MNPHGGVARWTAISACVLTTIAATAATALADPRTVVPEPVQVKTSHDVAPAPAASSIPPSAAATKPLPAIVHGPGWKSFAEIQHDARSAGYQAALSRLYTRFDYPKTYGDVWDKAHAPGAHLTLAPSPPLLSSQPVPSSPLPHADSERFEALKATIAHSRTGQEALELQKKYGVTVTFSDDKGEYGHYDAPSNQLVLGTHQNAYGIASTFVHEMTHAEFKNTAKTVFGRETSLSRDDYVGGNLHEEAVSASKQAEAYRDFRRDKDGRATLAPLWEPAQAYLEAYKRVIADGRAARKSAPPTAR